MTKLLKQTKEYLRPLGIKIYNVPAKQSNTYMELQGEKGNSFYKIICYRELNLFYKFDKSFSVQIYKLISDEYRKE